MSTEQRMNWAPPVLLWVWVIGIVIAAGVGVFFGTTSGNLMIGLTWGIALAVAWVVVFALVRAQRRRGTPARHDTEAEPEGP